MNKLELAQDINYSSDVYRTISVDRKLNFQVGQIVDNLGLSWCTRYGIFNIENDRKYEYFFRCEKPVNGHEVDYENEEECEILGAEGCENECEVLVPLTQKFKITYVSSDEDYEEIKYYDIWLEPIE